ncbi:MAG: flagellar basal body rod protein FlgB [Deltaproteobacteria bacterium]|nr:flagellar basal body rod protein FlgB [Deltaproteobacteria bacterium]
MADASVFDRTIGLMKDRLSLNSLNQKVISGNLANLNTPGYAAKELSFDKALRESLEDQVLQMVRSNGGHLAPDDLTVAMRSPETVETGPVDLDQEMLKLSRNSIEYQLIVGLLNKKFAMMKQAIGEGAQ